MSTGPKNILVVTVGGSCEPIVGAIGKPSKYDFVYFVCSTGRGNASSEVQVDGPGRPCKGKKDLPSIVARTGLHESKYSKFTFDTDNEIDDIAILYKKLKGLASEIDNEFTGARVTANYTGGTKSMSAALVLVALEAGWELQVNMGMRQNVVSVISGDVPVPINTDVIQIDRNLKLYEEAFSKYNYSMAEMVADATLRSLIAARDERAAWIERKTVARGFNLWDSFFYHEALEVLEGVGRRVGRHLPQLRAILVNSMNAGYLMVADLVLNAERRAHQGRFDDGVARLYRAMELFAQERLKEEFGLDTGNLAINDHNIPAEFRSRFAERTDEANRFQIGLKDAYELLSVLDDPVGELFQERKSRLLQSLKTRNYSFLAHGFKPVDHTSFKDMHDVIQGFIQECIMKILGRQFKWPQQLPQRL